jgi:hypothetical protein
MYLLYLFLLLTNDSVECNKKHPIINIRQFVHMEYCVNGTDNIDLLLLEVLIVKFEFII